MNVCARQRLYRPPAEDEPLDPIQLALAKTLIRIITKNIREELAAEDAAAQGNAPPADGTAAGRE